MLAAERRNRIADSVRARGSVAVAELAQTLDISETTVRRDLGMLARDGGLVRTRGGAVAPDGLAHEPTYRQKAAQAAGEKRAIAELAASMVRPGDSILLGPGTTTEALARALVDAPELTVVTNSLLVVQALMAARHVEVILIGGTLRRSIHALVGPAPEDSLRSLRASQAFISGNGLTAERGLSTPSPLVAATDRALAAAAQQRVVMADHTKLGRETMCQTVPLESIDVLITDSNADPDVVAALLAAGVDVRIAEVAPVPLALHPREPAL